MIHFAYAVPPSQRPWLRRLEYGEWALLRHLPWLPTTWRFGKVALGSESLSAPWSITVNLYHYLAARHPIRLYDLHERVRLRYGPDDVILGHPWFEPGLVIESALRDPRPCRLKALIFPIHHGLPVGSGPEDNTYASPMVELADVVFGIMGPYWYDTLEASRFAGWKEKIVRLDMAVDTVMYPRVKHRFNPPRERGILYIGSNRPAKGGEVLSRTMAHLAKFRRGWIGPGEEIPSVPRIAQHANLSAEFMRSIADRYDIFVNMSISDANPTTILEAMAWGFPVACTPQSGYYGIPGIVSLSTTDIEGNVQALRKLLDAPNSDLVRLADENRRLVETHYTWERFCSTVWQQIERRLRGAQ